MGIFGWSYPPGCTGPPDDDFPDPSPLVEEVLARLEAADVPAEVCDKVVSLIEAWEQSQIPPEPDPLDGEIPW